MREPPDAWRRRGVLEGELAEAPGRLLCTWLHAFGRTAQLVAAVAAGRLQALTTESIARWTSTRPIDFGEEAVPWNARTASATGAAATVASTVVIFVSSFLPGKRQRVALRAMAAA